MNNDNSYKIFERFLKPLGFTDEAIRLYISLTQSGAIPLLEASRLSGIERTRLYRITEDLEKKGLIERVIGHKRKLIKACEPDKIYLMIKDLKNETEKLEHNFNDLTKTVNSLFSGSPITKVLYFNGRDGLRQMLWNQLNTKTEILAYSYRVLQEAAGVKFFDNWSEEFGLRKLKIRDLRGNEFLQSILPYKKVYVEGEMWRYIPPEVLDINYELDIYDNVLAIFNWYEGEVFGVEIHNQKVANMQRQIFETFWKIAKPYTTAITKTKLIKDLFGTHKPKDLG